jgi:hypothetical protein
LPIHSITEVTSVVMQEIPDYVLFKEYVSNEINKLPQYDALYSAVQPRLEPDFHSVVGVGLLIQRQCRPIQSGSAISVGGWLYLDGWVGDPTVLRRPPPPRPSHACTLQDPAARIVGIVPGFAAHQSGRFQLGDLLAAIAHTAAAPWEASRTASLAPEEMRDLIIGPAGTAVRLRMVRGEEAPPMLRGVEYAVTLRRSLPAGAERSVTAAERSAVLSLTGRGGWGPAPAGRGAMAPARVRREVGVTVSAAAAAATELVRRVERLLGCGRDGRVDSESAGEGVRGGCEHFYV